jgi:hypothetical protein
MDSLPGVLAGVLVEVLPEVLSFVEPLTVGAGSEELSKSSEGVVLSMGPLELLDSLEEGELVLKLHALKTSDVDANASRIKMLLFIKYLLYK